MLKILKEVGRRHEPVGGGGRRRRGWVSEGNRGHAPTSTTLLTLNSALKLSSYRRGSPRRVCSENQASGHTLNLIYMKEFVLGG